MKVGFIEVQKMYINFMAKIFGLERALCLDIITYINVLLCSIIVLI